jgi:thiol-disulfide isomerase/thioredoxin
MLRGKGVFLWFFDEDCPRCRGKWPELIKISSELANEPVIFVAVNSGNAPQEVAAYARSVGLRWPVIADISRELEAKAGVGEISLQNIWKAAIITPKGDIQQVSINDIPGAVRRASVGASWKVDPTLITDVLKPSWRAIEMNVYTAGARDIMRYRESGEGANQQAAEALYAVVKKDMIEESEQAWNLGKEQKYFESYLALTQVKQKYAGYDLPDDVEKAYDWLTKKEEVRNEIKATEVLQSSLNWLQSPKVALRKRGITGLENIVSKFPGTQAAVKAQQLLAEGGSP